MLFQGFFLSHVMRQKGLQLSEPHTERIISEACVGDRRKSLHTAIKIQAVQGPSSAIPFKKLKNAPVQH